MNLELKYPLPYTPKGVAVSFTTISKKVNWRLSLESHQLKQLQALFLKDAPEGNAEAGLLSLDEIHSWAGVGNMQLTKEMLSEIIAGEGYEHLDLCEFLHYVSCSRKNSFFRLKQMKIATFGYRRSPSNTTESVSIGNEFMIPVLRQYGIKMRQPKIQAYSAHSVLTTMKNVYVAVKRINEPFELSSSIGIQHSKPGAKRKEAVFHY